MRKSILFVVNEPWFFLSHRLPIARAALAAGYDVHVATKDGEGVERINTEGFIYHEIPFTRSSMHLLDELRIIITLFRLYSNVKPSLVHHVTIKPVIYGSLAAKLSNVPKVVNAISGLGHIFTDSGYIALIRRCLIGYAYRLLLKKKNEYHVIFQNPDDKRTLMDLAQLREENVTIIHGSGVDVDVFSPQPEPTDTLVVVLAARMLWDKGVGEFVGAARLLDARGVKACFILAGDPDVGNPRSINHETLKEWSERDNVEWLGFQADIPALYARANIVCLPSYYGEGVPKSLIEAASCGRPIVTTNEPGCREIVRHDVNGLLVPAKDVKSLADSIEKLLYSPELRKKMGRNGREMVISNFSLDQVVHDTLSLYERLLST